MTATASSSDIVKIQESLGLKNANTSLVTQTEQIFSIKNVFHSGMDIDAIQSTLRPIANELLTIKTELSIDHYLPTPQMVLLYI